MQIFTARVRGGVILLEDGITLPEGTAVVVVAGDAFPSSDLREREEAELEESIREADAGRVVTAEELLDRLRQRLARASSRGGRP